ncbi:GntR family transcriptional regulator [Gracilibacillus alcaliphilus]|uniref:GntR family transcriptional regulator n=1 Tax=Gracilibacillus alcaliphilus TaxID=1401441 RepID=UPI001EF78607|nr:GntR family transcriptional regulator [Gracilibacillus alcaliphilus]MBM7676836.1 GntR family mannosyl-D-glycerate transport/metabolism transcriptional repressor [Gracilibacillus alcaliphilus]
MLYLYRVFGERLVLMWNKSMPLYKEVANKIKEDINSSKLVDGDMIPSETKLSKMYQVSRVTIRHAIKLLIDENLLYRVHGSGTYIKKEKIEYDILNMESFTAEMIEKNTDFYNEILEFSYTLPTSYVKKILGLADDEKIFFVKRLRYVNEEPSLLEESHIPAKLFPELSVDIMKQSLYEHIQNKGYQVTKRHGELEPIMPDSDLTQLFQLDQNVPVLLMKHHSELDEEIMFEYTKIYFHPNKYTLKLNYSK